MANLERLHPDYEKNMTNWKIIRDLIQGEQALKEHDIGQINRYITNITVTTGKVGLCYLPFISTSNDTNENVLRYRTYVERASLFNATRRTEKGMVGMVFSKPSTVELPQSLRYLEYSADGSNTGIIDQSVEVLEDVLETGRSGLFVDYPRSEGQLTVEELQESNMRANIIKYTAEEIMDWSVTTVGASQKLNFVKLREKIQERKEDDIFEIVETVRYRVLMLLEGTYIQRVYYGEDDYDEFIPTDYLGQPFESIPFFFVGATDNRPDCDIAPLLEIGQLNIKHYRNSADYEESAYLVGQPTVAVTGLDQMWIEEYYPDGIKFGSRQCLMLPPNASIDIVQADENNLSMRGMQEKENQMKMLGARLITDGGQAETAEAARIRHAADTSVLKVVVKNITDAYNMAIMAVQLYNGSVEDFIFKLNDDFFSDKFTIADLQAIVGIWLDSGIISQEAILSKLEEMNLAK